LLVSEKHPDRTQEDQMDVILEQYFDLSLMAEHFDDVLAGFWITIKLSIVGGILALAWGLVLSLLRQLPGRAFLPVRFLTISYIDVFRGIPLLMIIVLISGSLPVLPLPEAIRIPRWLGQPDPFWYGVMALTITYGAYMAEVYRAGIESVPSGQMEAARSLGMSHGQAMRNVIVPQAVRRVFAPLLNDFIALMKDTTLVSVIALNEVVLVGRDVQSSTFNSSALTLGAIMFLIVTLPLARVVDRLIAREQGRFTRGAPRTEAL
jgi:polar amino acid transport system permease protein